jgi:hypothetical protein
MDYIEVIRKLARAQYFQNIYQAFKESGSINLFDNINNYSGLQSLFLYWLRVYDLLYSEMAQKEWKYLSEDVVEDDVRCDAFLHWRGLQRSNEIDKYKQEKKVNKTHFKKPGKISTFDVDLKGN